MFKLITLANLLHLSLKLRQKLTRLLQEIIDWMRKSFFYFSNSDLTSISIISNRYSQNRPSRGFGFFSWWPGMIVKHWRLIWTLPLMLPKMELSPKLLMTLSQESTLVLTPNLFVKWPLTVYYNRIALPNVDSVLGKHWKSHSYINRS